MNQNKVARQIDDSNKPVDPDVVSQTVAVASQQEDEVDMSAEEIEEHNRLQTQVYVDEMDSKLDTEEPDVEWGARMGSDMETMIAEAHSDGLINTHMTSHRCARTLCTATYTHGSMDEQMSFERYAQNLPENGPGFLKHIETDDGSFRTVVYYGREGHALVGDAAKVSNARRPAFEHVVAVVKAGKSTDPMQRS